MTTYDQQHHINNADIIDLVSDSSGDDDDDDDGGGDDNDDPSAKARLCKEDSVVDKRNTDRPKMHRSCSRDVLPPSYNSKRQKITTSTGNYSYKNPNSDCLSTHSVKRRSDSTCITGSTTTSRSTGRTDEARNNNAIISIALDVNDTAILNPSIMEIYFRKFYKKSTSSVNIYTCMEQTLANNNNANSNHRIIYRPPTLTVQHIQQRDKWSCGFRNLQMLLSAILPYYYHSENRNPKKPKQQQNSIWQHSSSPSPQPHQYRDTTEKKVILPSLLQLQQSLEDAWHQGWDSPGAKHYQYQISNKVGKAAMIGAMEVITLLWYCWNIDATVVQFIHCYESRRYLPLFCKAYFAFQQPNKNNYYSRNKNDASSYGGDDYPPRCSFCFPKTAPSSRELVDKLLTSCATTFLTSNGTTTTSTNWGLLSHHNSSNSSTTTSNHGCSCPLLPLYLQWEGHSVTVVGIIEELDDDNSNRHNHKSELFLLVLDPLQHGRKLEQEFQRNHNLRPLRRNVKNYLNKDTQIILCTMKNNNLDNDNNFCSGNVGCRSTNSSVNRQKNNNHHDHYHQRKNIILDKTMNIVTAANDAVHQSRQKNERERRGRSRQEQQMKRKPYNAFP